MAKKSKKKKPKTRSTNEKLLKSAEKRCRLLGSDDLKTALQDATMRIGRSVRTGELEDAELYSRVVTIALTELRRRE